MVVVEPFGFALPVASRRRDSTLSMQGTRGMYGYIAIVFTLLLSISVLVLTASPVSSEHHRPRYHIVAPKGKWMNDPNGPFYDKKNKLYHLFYQYNPYDFHWGNMSWYHLVSKDLLIWKTLPVALYPDKPYGKYILKNTL